MKKLSSFSFAVIGCAAFLWIAAHLVLCLKADGWVSGILRDRYGISVPVTKVRTNFFGSFTLTLGGPEWGNAVLTWRVVPARGWKWQGKLTADEIKSETVLNRLRGKFPSLPVLTGPAGIKSEFSGVLRPAITILRWNVDLKGKNFLWTRPDGGEKIRFSADIGLGPDAVTVRSLVLRSVVNIKGTIESPWKSPVLHLTARADNASLSHLLDAIDPNNKNDLFGGSASFLAKIEGPLATPEIKGSGSLNASYAKVQLPEARGAFSFIAQKLDVDANFAEGQVAVKANLAGPVPSWDIGVSHVSLGAIAHPNGWNTVAGIVNSHLKFTSNGPSLAEGSFDIDRFRWGRFKAQSHVVARLTVNDRVVRLTSDALNLKVALDDAVAKVEEFKILFGKGSRVVAGGSIDLKSKKINLKVDANNVPPDLWPPLVERYPAIAGSMDVKGAIKGTLGRIITDGDVSFSDLKFFPNGGSWEGQAKLKGSPEEYSLSDIRIAGGYGGDVTWNPSRRKGLFKIRAKLDQADPRLFFDIFESTARSGGVVTGEVDLVVRDLKPVGTAVFSWVKGVVGRFEFDEMEAQSRFEIGKVFFDQFAIRQGPRAMQATGVGVFRNNGWDTTATVQLQRWGTSEVFVDGESQWTGRVSWPDFNVNGILRAPLVWVNDFPIENLNSEIKRNGRTWTVSGESQKNVRFYLIYDQKKFFLDGSVDIDGLPMQDLFAKVIADPIDIPKGPLTLSGRFKGPLGKIGVKVDVATKETEWRKEKFDLNASLRLNASSVSVTHAEARMEKGGTLTVVGGLSRDGTMRMAFSGKGARMSMQSVFNLLDWSVKWDGRVDGDFEFNGLPEENVVRVMFDGKHDGFGPFALGGKISGTVTGANNQWDVSGVRVESGEGYVTLRPGSNIYTDRNKSGTMRLLADSRYLKAGPLTFFGGAEITGAWRSPSGLTPSTEKTPIDLDVFARALWINQYVLDGNVTHLTLRKGEVEFSPIPGSGQQLSGILSFSDYPEMDVKQFRLIDNGEEKCFLEGKIGADRWDYVLRLKQVDAAILRSLLDTDIPITGKMDADLRGKGSAKKPEFSGDLTLNDGRLDVLPIDTAQCAITYKNGIIDAQEIRASRKKGYLLTGRVRFQVDPDSEVKVPSEINLVVENGDLAFLREVWPEITKARGTFTARFQVGTKSWGRSISGFLNAEKVSMVSTHTPNLHKGQVRMRLDKNRLTIEETRANFGKGNLELAGYVDFRDGLPDFYNLSLRTTNANGVSIRVPELAISPGPFLGQFGILKRRLAGASRGEPLINLILKGPSEGPLLAGTIELENAIFTYPPAVAIQSDGRKTAFRRWVKQFWEKLKLDVSVVAGSRTWYQNELVDANISGAVHFTGPVSDLDVNGRIRTEQGSIVYSGSEFRIKDAVLELETRSPAFSDLDAKHTFVYLKAEAEKQVFYTDGLSNNNQDIIVMTVDRSLIGEIQPRFYSRYNPNLSPERALQLALGLPLSTTVDNNSLLPDQRATSQADQREDTDKMLRLGLVQLLDSSLASPLARALARNTGLIDVIRISYQEKDLLSDNSVAVGESAAGSSNNITQNQFLRYAKGTKVKFGRGISSRLFADYSFRVDDYQNQLNLRHEVELSYQLKRNLYLRGISELDNQNELGRVPDRRAILENQWRFGLPKPKVPLKPLKESKATPARSLYTRPS